MSARLRIDLQQMQRDVFWGQDFLRLSFCSDGDVVDMVVAESVLGEKYILLKTWARSTT